MRSHAWRRSFVGAALVAAVVGVSAAQDPSTIERRRRLAARVARLKGGGDAPTARSPSGTRPLAEVAGSCGFADQSHMSHALQRAIGLSPLQLRRLSRMQVANLQERRRHRAQAVVLAQRDMPA